MNAISTEDRQAVLDAYERANNARQECFSHFRRLSDACRERHPECNDEMRAWSTEVEQLNQGSDATYTALQKAETAARDEAGETFSRLARRYPWIAGVAHRLSWLGVENPQERANEAIDGEFRDAVVEQLREQFGPEIKPLREQLRALPVVRDPSALPLGAVCFSNVGGERLLTVRRRTHNGKRTLDEKGERLSVGRLGGYMDSATGYQMVEPQWAGAYRDVCERWKQALKEQLP